MISQSKTLSLLNQAYDFMLVLYPREYREEYGVWMKQLFNDLCRDAAERGGNRGVLITFFSLVFDLLLNAVCERRESLQSLSRLPRSSNWAASIIAIAGLNFCVFALSQLQPGSHMTFRGFYQIAFVCFVPALLCFSFGFAINLRKLNLNQISRAGMYSSCVNAALAAFFFVAMHFDENSDAYSLCVFFFLAHFLGFLLWGMSLVAKRMNIGWHFLPLLFASMPLLLLIKPTSYGYGPQYHNFAFFLLVGFAYILLAYAITKQQLKYQML